MATTKSILRSLTATALNGSTGAVGLARQQNHVLLIRVTAIVGGAGNSLTVTPEDSPDATNFYTIVTGLAITATGAYRIGLPAGLARDFRASWVIAGGATWTFELTHASDPVS